LLACRNGGRREGVRHTPSVTMLRTLPALVAACLSLLAFVPTAAHASVSQILRDCQLHGHLTGHYSQKELAQALAALQGDQAEYSDCASYIREAEAAAARAGAAKHHAATGSHATTAGAAGGRSGGSGPSSPSGHAATPADQKAIRQALHRAGSVPLPGGGTISPTTSSAAGASGLNTLPVPLVIVLILLAAGALTGVGLGVRRRVLDRGFDS
jgi:hypothetical protein